MIDISNGNKSLEEALARTLSFQNIEKINSNFMAIDKKYDLGRVLKKPYKNRKESLYEQINRLRITKPMVNSKQVTRQKFQSHSQIKAKPIM